MFPTPGTRWSKSLHGAVYTVRDVDLRRGILLTGDAGEAPERVLPYQWPGEWGLIPGESVDGEGVTERHPMRAMLVGGAEGKHLLRIQEILAESGFELTDHVPGYGSSSLPRIPAEVEVIVALVSHLGHPLYTNAKLRAKEAGLPMLLAESGGFREDLRKERLRLGLGAWEKVGGLARPGSVDGGWWTWNGKGWERTTPAMLRGEEEPVLEAGLVPALPQTEDVAPGHAAVGGGGDSGLSAALALVGIVFVLKQ